MASNGLPTGMLPSPGEPTTPDTPIRRNSHLGLNPSIRSGGQVNTEFGPDNALRIGDIISLKSPKYRGYLSADGVLSESVCLSSNSLFFEEHLFQIYVQRQYSATNELAEYRSATKDVATGLMLAAADTRTNFQIPMGDSAEQSHVEALIRGKENESLLNLSVMQAKAGKPICFGDTIQLLHIKSQKFVTVSASNLARDERENMRVVLSYDGSMMSWLTIMPRFKIDREGEVITNSTEVFFKISERSTEYLHVADRNPPRGKLREVNSSMELPTSWKMTVFCRIDEVSRKNILLCGQLVTIRDPEVQSFLAPIERPIDLRLTHNFQQNVNQGPTSDTQSFLNSPQFRSFQGLSLMSPNARSMTFSDPNAAETPMLANSVFQFPSSSSIHSESSHPSAKPPGSANPDDESDNDSICSMEDFTKDNGTVVLRIPSGQSERSEIDTDMIWMMESRFISRGGLVSFATDRIHLRHFNTGKYLSLRPSDERPDTMLFSLDDEINEKYTLFQLQPLHSTSDTLSDGQAINLRHVHTNHYLLRGAYHDDHHLYRADISRNRSKAVSFLIQRYVQMDSKTTHSKGAPTISAVVDEQLVVPQSDQGQRSSTPASSVRSTVPMHIPPLGEALDIYFAKAVVHHLEKYVRATTTPNLIRTDVSSIWPRLDHFDRAFFPRLMARVTLFLRGYPIRATSADEISRCTVDESIIEVRQHLLRSVGLLQSVMLMIKSLQAISDIINGSTLASSAGGHTPNSGSFINNGSIHSTTTSSGHVRTPKGAFLESGKEVLSECLHCLFDLIRNNERNQLYISNHLLIIFSHVSTDAMAAQIAQELLGSNRALQETKISQSVITAFTESMKEIPMNAMHLRLLRTCCSCMNQGLPKNQDIINRVLFSQHKDVLIRVELSRDKCSHPDWGKDLRGYDMILGSRLSRNVVRGESLIVDGTPTVMVTWSVSGKIGQKLQPMAIFRKQMVPLSDIMRFNQKASLISSGGSNDTAEGFKRSIGVFLIAQIELSAEVCLDRNYPAIADLEKAYPYELLVAILKTSGNGKLCGAVAYLLHNLYINRDPQSEVRLPRLTRVLDEANGSAYSEVVWVPEPQRYEFSLLQIIIASHLDEIVNHIFPPHTLSLINVLHSLIRFNFYGNITMMRDVVDALVVCLRRHDFDAVDAVDIGEIGRAVQKLSITTDTNAVRRIAVKAGGLTRRPIPESTTRGPKSIGISPSLGDGDSDFDDDEETYLYSKSPLLRFIFGVYYKYKKRRGRRKLRRKRVFSRFEKLNSVISNFSRNVLRIYYTFYVQLIFVVFLCTACIVSIYGLYKGMSKNREFKSWEFAVFLIIDAEFLLHLILSASAHGTVRVFFSQVPYLVDGFSFVFYLLAFFFMSGDSLKYVKFSRLSRVLMLPRFYYDTVYSRKSNWRSRDITQSSSALTNIDPTSSETPQWTMPKRYIKTGEYTLKTLVKIVDVLNHIQTNIEDRTLSLFVRRFHKCIDDQRFVPQNAPDVFLEVSNLASDFVVINDNIDLILIDLLMYPHAPLVQSVLNLLMRHHSSKSIFRVNLSNLQLITKPQTHEKFKRLEGIVATVKRDADTHEIWGKLTSVEHQRTNRNMHANLEVLLSECRALRTELKIDEPYQPVQYIQNILRNLGCFEICLKISQFVTQWAVKYGEASQSSIINTRKLSKASNRLLYWMIIDNPTNQMIAHDKLKFFIDTVDDRIESDKVLKAIFYNNLELMEQVPRQYLIEFIDLIVSTGRFPQYLSLISSILNVGEKNMITNQYEVIRLVSSPENLKRVVCFFVPTNHPDYKKKIRLMSQYLNVKDITNEEIPQELDYHLCLMQLLSSCTIGRTGMTTIEAKVQSMFHFVDIIEAILDPRCLWLAKVRLGQFLFNAVLDVETIVPAIKDARCIWDLFEYMLSDVLPVAREELRMVDKHGWSPESMSLTPNRHLIEFALICVMIVEAYFGNYFDYNIFRPEMGQSVIGVERVQMREENATTVILRLFTAIDNIYQMNSALLSYEHHKLLHVTLRQLNAICRDKPGEIPNNHDVIFRQLVNLDLNQDDRNGTLFEQCLFHINNSPMVTEEIDSQIQHIIKLIEAIPNKFENLGGSDSTDTVGKSDVRFEPLLERLVIHVRSSIKIVTHGSETTRTLDLESTKTGIWVLMIFRTMIENRWGMTIYERDDDGGEDQDKAVVGLMAIYSSCGVTDMCLELIAKGVDLSLQAEALKLLVAMLYKEGGALDIQRTIHNNLSKPGSETFFETVRHILQNLISWHNWNGVVSVHKEEEVKLPNEIIIVRCLQLMCEGHFEPNQNILREQPQNDVSINLLDDFVMYLQKLDLIKCRTSTTAELLVSATILELCQGPCEGNQDYFALNTELIETLNRKLRQNPVNDCDPIQELEIKRSAIDIFQALLEGQGRKTSIYERMLSVIHVDVIVVLCRGEASFLKNTVRHIHSKKGVSRRVRHMMESDDQHEEENKDDSSPIIVGIGEEMEEPEASVQLRTESLVLLQMLLDFRPSLRVELGLDEDIKTLGHANDSVACIELVWRGELQRRFFHIPDVCFFLAKSTRDNFLLHVNRTSPEDKLYGLLDSAKDMYREVLHQQVLQIHRLDIFFSRTIQDTLVWANFYLVLLINVVFLLFYTVEPVHCSDNDFSISDGFLKYNNEFSFTKGTASAGSESLGLTEFQKGDVHCNIVTISEPAVTTTIHALNIVLIFGASYALLCSLVVRAPVNFISFHERGHGFLRSVLHTAADFSTMYFVLYLSVAVLGLYYHPFLSFLLLDFVTNSPTTQSVLNAVYNPRKQIFITILLTFIVMYIFSIFEFFFFNNDGIFFIEGSTVTLGNHFKFLLRWGLPQNSPQNQMEASIHMLRVVCDLAYFFSCVILLNILKGITIDTFVELRKELESRTVDTMGKCFICGIDKNTFNRTLDRNAFDQHVRYDQNLWNYLYFIFYIWEQDKDDDDGLESFVRRCIDTKDLVWFPINKAMRLAEHQFKGDIHSLKYRFHQEMLSTEKNLQQHMQEFKVKMSRSIARVEKALDYENDYEQRTRTRSSVARFRMPSATQRPSFTGGGTTISEVMRSGRSNSVMGSRMPQLMSLQNGTSDSREHDGSGHIHVRVISVSGLVLAPAFLKYVTVKVSSNYQSVILQPITEVEVVDSFSNDAFVSVTERIGVPSRNSSLVSSGANASPEPRTSISLHSRSSFSLNPNIFVAIQAAQQAASNFQFGQSFSHEPPSPRANFSNSFSLGSFSAGIMPRLNPKAITQVELKFDSSENPSILVHQGPLPVVDLTKVYVSVQVLFSPPSDPTREGGGNHSVFMGGLKVPLSSLLNNAHAGEVLDLHFSQRAIEVMMPQTSTISALTNSNSQSRTNTLSLPNSDTCMISLSSIASQRLLQQWAFQSTISDT